MICIFTVLQDQFWRPNIFENESLLHTLQTKAYFLNDEMGRFFCWTVLHTLLNVRNM